MSMSRSLNGWVVMVMGNKSKKRMSRPTKSIEIEHENFVAGYYAGAEAGVSQAVLLTLYVLNKHFGYGTVRLERYYKELSAVAESINNDGISFEELSEEMGSVCKFDLPKLVRVG